MQVGRYALAERGQCARGDACGPATGAVAAAMPGDPRRSCSAASSPSSAPSDCSKDASAAWTVFSRTATSASAASLSAPALGIGLAAVVASGFLYDWATGRARSERVLRSSSSSRSASLSSDSAALDAWDQGCGVRRLRLGLEPSHLPRRPRPAGARARHAPGRRPPESAARPLAECAFWSDLPIPSSTASGLGQELREWSHLPRDPSSPTRRGVHRRARRSIRHRLS